MIIAFGGRMLLFEKHFFDTFYIFIWDFYTFYSVIFLMFFFCLLFGGKWIHICATFYKPIKKNVVPFKQQYLKGFNFIRFSQRFQVQIKPFILLSVIIWTINLIYFTIQFFLPMKSNLIKKIKKYIEIIWGEITIYESEGEYL